MAHSNNAAATALAPARKVALITSITGLLLSKRYEVLDHIRRSSNFNTQRLDHIYHDLHAVSSSPRPPMRLHYADLSDSSSLRCALDAICPDKVYNLAAQSHVAISFEVPDYTADVTATRALHMLVVVRLSCKPIRYYHATPRRCSAPRRHRRARTHPSTRAPPTPLPRSSCTAGIGARHGESTINRDLPFVADANVRCEKVEGLTENFEAVREGE
ncbi:GDP-mannose 4,6 dehydratase 2 [Sorghum bicolor]|uniref:GDP-mannose 4,6 dehydratase 2 n=1 Tax=Sorghum bicolor TaxID=4558 RepID=UPI000B424270|nr:GDP-mannose 4,6 dehydratase 2 [Sorghum bicolor]|eukprot:XP_021308472.1 GDP-mannose 4,6 dehydratase 2 [Sorghum bicolor]